ncbi:MAG: hypothetical protein ABI453_03905 [Isosphaeraceae bacterium]
MDAIGEQADAMIRAWAADDDSLAFGTPAVPGEASWKDLRALADQAIGKESELRPWFVLGAAVGLCQGHIQDCGFDPIVRFGDIERQLVHQPSASYEILPQLQRVADAARSLPQRTLAVIPVLSAFVERLPALGDRDQPISSTKFFAGDWHGLRRYAGPDLNLANADWFLDRIDQSIQEVAGQAVLPTMSNPHWDRERSKLLLDGKVIREVSKQAKNILQILDTFEEDGWPDRIDDPISGPPESQPTRCHEAVRSLNEGLKMIRFRSDGTGAGITWERK